MARKKRKKAPKKEWYIVDVRDGSKDAFMSKGGKKYSKNKQKYKVFGPFTHAKARFDLYGA